MEDKMSVHIVNERLWRHMTNHVLVATQRVDSCNKRDIFIYKYLVIIYFLKGFLI